jgi:hypothetical protein
MARIREPHDGSPQQRQPKGFVDHHPSRVPLSAPELPFSALDDTARTYCALLMARASYPAKLGFSPEGEIKDSAAHGE